MPCQKSSTFSAPFSGQARSVQATSGPFATEAECNQACREGACCEGTTCTVKPACQCQCTTGRCCGPDTTTAGGTTWKTCRNETKAQCDARGGVFQCGVSCTTGVIGDAAGSTAGSVCLNGTGDVANAGPVFKGVGTTCATGVCCTPFTNGCSPPFVGNVALSFPQTITASVSVDAGATWPFGPQPLSGAYAMDYAAPQTSNECAQYSRVSTVQGKFVDVRSSWFFTSVNGVATPAMSFTMWDFALSYWGFFAFPATGPCAGNSYIPATACFSASADLYQRTRGQNEINNYPCNQTWTKVGTVQVSG